VLIRAINSQRNLKPYFYSQTAKLVLIVFNVFFQRVSNADKLESFLSRLQVLDYDSAAAYQTAIIRAELRRLGAPIGAYDGMIAGHARSHSLTVVTNNVSEFVRIPGLMIENWLQQSPQLTINEPLPAYR